MEEKFDYRKIMYEGMDWKVERYTEKGKRMVTEMKIESVEQSGYCGSADCKHEGGKHKEIFCTYRTDDDLIQNIKPITAQDGRETTNVTVSYVLN